MHCASVHVHPCIMAHNMYTQISADLTYLDNVLHVPFGYKSGFHCKLPYMSLSAFPLWLVIFSICLKSVGLLIILFLLNSSVRLVAFVCLP